MDNNRPIIESINGIDSLWVNKTNYAELLKAHLIELGLNDIAYVCDALGDDYAKQAYDRIVEHTIIL